MNSVPGANPQVGAPIASIVEVIELSNTVLIVDDADFMRAMLKDILEGMGLDIVGEACDAESAIQEFRSLHPDLVLLDTTLPDVEGLEALTGILATDPEAQVIMVTPLGQRDTVLAAIKAGARDFIIKPFDEPMVATTIQHTLQTCPL